MFSHRTVLWSSSGVTGTKKHTFQSWTHTYMYTCESLSRVRLFATPWTVARQAPLSMEFSRQENWSGLPFPTPGIFLTQEWNLRLFCLLDWQAGSLPLSHLGRPLLFLLVNIWTTFSLGRDFLSNKSFPNSTGRSWIILVITASILTFYLSGYFSHIGKNSNK